MTKQDTLLTLLTTELGLICMLLGITISSSIILLCGAWIGILGVFYLGGRE